MKSNTKYVYIFGGVLTVHLTFKTQSSPLYVKQEHKGTKGSYQISDSKEEYKLKEIIDIPFPVIWVFPIHICLFWGKSRLISHWPELWPKVRSKWLFRSRGRDGVRIWSHLNTDQNNEGVEPTVVAEDHLLIPKPYDVTRLIKQQVIRILDGETSSGSTSSSKASNNLAKQIMFFETKNSIYWQKLNERQN